MTISETFRSFDEETFTGVRKDYRGGAYSFLAILPRQKKDIAAVLDSIQGPGFDKSIAKMRPYHVTIRFPRLAYKETRKLNGAFAKLEMAGVFRNADFSPISDNGGAASFLSRVLHGTYVEVDERGTKFAAVTGEAAAGVPEEMVFDRPFLYAVRHNPTGDLLLIGICGDPSQVDGPFEN